MSGFLDQDGLGMASLTEEAPCVSGRSFEERGMQKDSLKRALSTTRVLAAEKDRPTKREPLLATAGKTEESNVTTGLKKTESEEATIELLQATGDLLCFTDFEHVFSSGEEEADTVNMVEVCSERSNAGHLEFPPPIKSYKEDTDATPLGNLAGRRKNSAKRVERTIASTFLPKDFKHAFRITLQSNNFLLREDLWCRMKDDFRVIGLLNDGGTTTKEGGICFTEGIEEVFETLVPLSCTNFCVDSSLYKPVLKHLPLKYSVRLCILRLIGRQTFLRSGQHIDSCQMPLVSLSKSRIIQIVRFFQTSIVDELPCEDRMKFKRQTGRVSKGGKEVGRTKIHLTELGYEKFSIKSWQPTVDNDILQSILASCKHLDRGREHLPIVFMPTAAGNDVASAGYFRTTSFMTDDCSMPLSSYAWTMEEKQHQVAEMRHNMIIMLSSDVDLCGLFAMKQIWGSDNKFRQQCSALQSFFSQ